MRNNLFAIILLFALTPFLRAQNTYVQPAFLNAGDKVAIIAPSYAVNDTSTVKKAVKLLKSWGLTVELGENGGAMHPEYIPKKGDKRRGYHYGGPLAARVSELKWALADDSIKAIFCVRGGYGTVQMMDYIPLSMYSNHPKWIVGFSDVTTLLAGETMAGVMSIHGDMCSTFNTTTGNTKSTEELRRLLFGKMPDYRVASSKWNVEGHAEGTLIGGNFITFVSLLESEYDVTKLDGTILFIEEVTESMHAVERLFHLLKNHGRLPHFKGIIFGSFHKCGVELLDHESIEEMLWEFMKPLGIPVCFGFPAGHGPINMPLVMGSHVSLDVTSSGSHISF